MSDVYQLVAGLDGPAKATMTNDIISYTDVVVRIEWPAQARGEAVVEDEPRLERLTRTALHLRPDNIADGDLHSLLLNDLTGLSTARRERLLIQRTSIPLLVWFVLLAGGSISIAFSSFLGARSLRMHLSMSALLALSGALILLIVALGFKPHQPLDQSAPF